MANPQKQLSPQATVIMRSRGSEEIAVADPRDAEFLRLADDFILEAEAVIRDPRRRKPRL